MSRLRVAATVLLAFLAVLAGDVGRDRVTPVQASKPSAQMTAGVSVLSQVLVPPRPSIATARWFEPTTGKTRSLPYPAVVLAATAGLLVVLLAGVVRRRSGAPWRHRRQPSAVLRAPPLLLHS